MADDVHALNAVRSHGEVRVMDVDVVTDGSGNATAYLPAALGYLYSLEYTKTDYADTVDFTITNETTGQQIWAESNVTASKKVHPRFIADDTAGTTLAALASAEKELLVNERIKIVIAAGGATKTGNFKATVVSW